MEGANIPTSRLTDKQLKLSYWYVTNKLLLRKIFLAFLVILSVVLWLYVFYGLVSFMMDYQRIQQQTNELLFSSASTANGVESTKPVPLAIGEIQVLAGEGDSYDLFSEIGNSNAGWLATFDYIFKSGTSTKAIRRGFVMPGEQKILVDLSNIESTGQLEISNLKWERIAGFDKIKNERSRFTVEGEEFVSSAKTGDPNRVKFNISNGSPYSYWDVGLVIGLYSSGNLVSINYLPLRQFMSGENRAIQMNWLQNISAVDSIMVWPETNFLDPKNIMQPKS